MKRFVASVVGALVFTVGASAFAQSAASAQAEELFKQGRAALEAKDYPTACRMLAESDRLERAVGTLFSLAQCEEAVGRVASARQHYREAGDLADALQDRLQRGEAARAKVKELEPRVPHVTIKPVEGAPSAMTVKQDDASLTSASFGTSLPIDPGKHVLIVTATGYEAKTINLEIAEGETKTVEIAPGAALPPPPPPPDPSTAAAPVQESGGGLRPLAYALGGVGVAGLLVGSIFGLSASSKWSDAKDECKPGACGAGSKAQGDQDDAKSAGNVSTVCFIAGGALLAAGVVLFVVDSPSSKSSAKLKVGPNLGGLSASGSF